jgi:hypothetical protein
LRVVHEKTSLKRLFSQDLLNALKLRMADAQNLRVVSRL